MTARRLSSLLFLFVAWLAVPAVAAAFPGANGRIVFSSEWETWQSELYSVAPDGTGATRLTWTATIEQHPAWSPDGSRIAFERLIGDGTRIHVMDADGSNERLVSPEGGTRDSDPTWSPDGTQIAFTSDRWPSGASAIWVMGLDGSGLRSVTAGLDPAWSPDGTLIAYTAPGERIAVVNPDGTGMRSLTNPPSGSFDGAPSWSPDGTRLVFARRDFGTGSQLWAVDADGSNERQLTFGEGASRFPSWSPDGTQIVFTYERRLHVIAPDGSGLRPLTALHDEALSPDWGTSTSEPSAPGAPTVHILSPEPTFYLPGTPVVAFYLCLSETSLVVSCEGDVPVGEFVDTSTTGSHVFTVRAVDAEGRTSRASVAFEVPDFQPPTVTVRAPADGAEYEVGEAVEVDYECADQPGGSGIELCDGELEPGWPLDTSTPGTFTVHFWAVDRARNFSQTSVTYRVLYRDRTPPAITVDSPAEGASYLLGATVLAAYECADEAKGTGVDLCAGDSPSGTTLDTSTVGPRTFTVRARDRAGNASEVTRSYRVVYAFSGFFAPLVAPPGFASLDAGDAVPVKFSLAGDRGLGVLAPGSPRWTRVDCGSGAALGDGSPARQTLSYLAGPDRYVLRVETEAAWRGTCRRLEVTLADGTTHFANVRFG